MTTKNRYSLTITGKSGEAR